MTRLLPLLPLVLWLGWSPRDASRPPSAWSLTIFLAAIVAVVLLLRTWGRLILRGDPGDLYRRAGRFQALCTVARIATVAWFGVGLYYLGWGELVERVNRPLDLHPVATPASLLAIFPAMVGWIAIAWAQYPIERRWREHNVLVRFDDLAALHPPPTIGQHLDQTLRLQLLFPLTPVFAVMVLRDVASLAWSVAYGPISSEADVVLSGASVLVVFALAPLLLMRVLTTTPLPAGPLRERLLAYCQRTRMRVGSIRLWHTHHTLSNAAVMGVLPQVRSVLLSDSLIESLDAAQIEAVFAHEAGHIRHRHMLWYLLFVVVAVTSLDRPLTWAMRPVVAAAGAWGAVVEGALVAVGVITWALVFGALSRRCERQADWYAARTIDTPDIGGERFAETLRRVALVNGMPIVRGRSTGRPLADAIGRTFDAAGHFLHGSIASRMQHVRDLAESPARAARFSAAMTLTFTTIAGGVVVVIAASFLVA